MLLKTKSPGFFHFFFKSTVLNQIHVLLKSQCAFRKHYIWIWPLILLFKKSGNLVPEPLNNYYIFEEASYSPEILFGVENNFLFIFFPL